MINQKEFYFVRHGQTDHNLSPDKVKGGDIDLNATGREQAKRLAPLIAELPLQSICCSSLQRALQTKELLAPGASHLEFEDLGECTVQIWHEMTSLDRAAWSKVATDFLERVRRGVNAALEEPGPVLIVAHGGVHMAICHWMGIEDHEWMIDNCQPVHFLLDDAMGWKARLLS